MCDSSTEGGVEVPERERWVHATNAAKFKPGDVFGWAAEESSTGFLSGIIVTTDFLRLRVLVRDVRPGVIRAV